MGMIARRLRRSGNEQFVAPRDLDTDLDQMGLFQLSQQLVAGLNDSYDQYIQQKNRVTRYLKEGSKYHYYCARATDGSVFISFQRQPQAILDTKSGRTSSVAGYWLAKIWPARTIDGEAEPANIRLIRWVTDEDGKINNADRYEQFVAELATSLDRPAPQLP